MVSADGSPLYTPELARIHHAHFGDVGAAAARELVARLGDRRGRVVELGVGSGVSSRVLLEAGFEVEGVDASAEMLALAETHAPGGAYRLGSLWDHPLDSPLAVTAFGEVLNYVWGEEVPDVGRLRRRFQEVRAALADGGVFLFDVTTRSELGEDEEDVRGVRFEAEDVFLVMEETQRDGELERVIDSFVLAEARALYRRVHEVHRLVLFEPDEVEALLRDVGFGSIERLQAFDGYELQEGWVGFAASD